MVAAISQVWLEGLTGLHYTTGALPWQEIRHPLAPAAQRRGPHVMPSPKTTILGVDFSGAKTDRNTWLAQGTYDGTP